MRSVRLILSLLGAGFIITTSSELFADNVTSQQKEWVEQKIGGQPQEFMGKRSGPSCRFFSVTIPEKMQKDWTLDFVVDAKVLEARSLKNVAVGFTTPDTVKYGRPTSLISSRDLSLSRSVQTRISLVDWDFTKSNDIHFFVGRWDSTPESDVRFAIKWDVVRARQRVETKPKSTGTLDDAVQAMRTAISEFNRTFGKPDAGSLDQAGAEEGRRDWGKHANATECIYLGTICNPRYENVIHHLYYVKWPQLTWSATYASRYPGFGEIKMYSPFESIVDSNRELKNGRWVYLVREGDDQQTPIYYENSYGVFGMYCIASPIFGHGSKLVDQARQILDEVGTSHGKKWTNVDFGLGRIPPCFLGQE